MVVTEWVRARIAVFVALVFVATTAPAFARNAAPQGAERWEPERLRRVIEERYRVAPLRDGVVLIPRGDSRDVKSIEITGDTVAINGTPVTGAEVRQRLKADSDAILALSYLDPESRRALFGPAASPGRPAAGAAPGGAGAPGEPAGQTASEPERETQPPTAAPESDRTEPRSRSESRVHIGGSVQVNDGELVDGPVVAIGGSVNVNGEVRQDVVAVGGNVTLGPKAKVGGDVTAVGGTVNRDSHAEVDGKVNEIGFRWPHIRLGHGFWFPGTGFRVGPWVEATATLFRMALFGLIAFLVFLIARNPVDRIERVAAMEPWKAGLVGVFTQLLFLPVFLLTIIILAISIVGIPLLLFIPPLAILALVAALFVGFTGVAYRVGRWTEQRFHWAQQSPYLLLLVGLLGIWALTIVGRIVALAGWPAWIAASTLLIVGFLVEYVAWTVGLGAAVLTRFGTRPVGGSGPVAPTAPATTAGPQVG